MRYEVAVVGLGAMGSATVADCARRGVSVFGLEQFSRGHELGSSTGKSRIIRKAYFEDPAYVPLLLRAYDLWRELERATGETLLRLTGLLMVGEEGCEIISGAARAAHEHSLPYESLSAHDLRSRYPMLKVRDEEVGLHEPDGGVLDPERSVAAQLQLAERAGAHLCFDTTMSAWEATADGFLIHLSDGSDVASPALVLSLGPWFSQTLAQLGVVLRVQRNVQAWFAPGSNAYTAPDFPAFLLERQGLPAPLYGFPDFGAGVKAAFHCHGALTDPAHVDRAIHAKNDIEPIRAAMEQWMPGASDTFLDARACMYSLTPDGHFVVDRHPEHPRLVLCGGFSGHGFKFAPVIGEIAADLAVDGNSRHDITFLSLQRFLLP